MIVRTLFKQNDEFRIGEVEVKLLPGIPVLHVVGRPDGYMRECGLRLKSALRSAEYQWPQGHQIVVNLRPSYLRKSSSGLDLAIALGFLALTNQVSAAVSTLLQTCIVYGEVTLDGRVFAPPDLEGALRKIAEPILSGGDDNRIRDGEWRALSTLRDSVAVTLSRKFSWEGTWTRPELPPLEFTQDAVDTLCLVAHAGLNVLVAGPQGSGKTTWAQALHALTPPPDPVRMVELRQMFGDKAVSVGWRPFERPHHTTSTRGMIGGGHPLTPGIISRAHGGVLVMDEFLEFSPSVLEGLREPIEHGYVEHARQGEKASYPARFQLVGTTNLCPCGKLNPEGPRPGVSSKPSCPHSLTRCRTVCARLSGPIMDRFDLLIFSHPWLHKGPRVSLQSARDEIDRLAAFATSRGPDPQSTPSWVRDLEFSHRRRNALLRVARALADREESARVRLPHYMSAKTLVTQSMSVLGQLFA